jgi:hypothetical protein
MTVSVMNFLSINRVDQAEKQLKAMAALDEDASLTQLAMAWVNIFLVRTARLFAPQPQPWLVQPVSLTQKTNAVKQNFNGMSCLYSHLVSSSLDPTIPKDCLIQWLSGPWW